MDRLEQPRRIDWYSGKTQLSIVHRRPSLPVSQPRLQRRVEFDG